MLIDALGRQAKWVADLSPRLRLALERLDDRGNLLLPQAVMLVAAALDLQADTILDLGTGGGNSAAAFALARGGGGTRLFTFDFAPAWDGGLKQKLGDLLGEIDRHVVPVIGDIAACDFTPLVANAKRVLVFWDAHGYAIAGRILSHLMPLIADKPHFVICHDISDNRLGGEKSYAGKPFWRGVEGANEHADTAYVNLGWVTSRVEQVLPILDFCWRNNIDLRSLDQELHVLTPPELRTRWLRDLGLAEEITFDMAYFSMAETKMRNFPARLSE